jgi:hypothetical protein
MELTTLGVKWGNAGSRIPLDISRFGVPRSRFGE